MTIKPWPSVIKRLPLARQASWNIRRSAQGGTGMSRVDEGISWAILLFRQSDFRHWYRPATHDKHGRRYVRFDRRKDILVSELHEAVTGDAYCQIVRSI